jgi:DNA-binding GntR family transcriptional regulator
MPDQVIISTLAPRVAEELRNRLIAGELKPGQRLSEPNLCRSLNVSRNTLREAFRLLSNEGLVRHEPNRGVFVGKPSVSSIVDIYRVRRMLECQAVANVYPKHPALLRMRAAVTRATAARADQAWDVVGHENMNFHEAIVDLADCQRLTVFYAKIAAELRLSFSLVGNPELLHDTYLDLNGEILRKIEAGKATEAAAELETYLSQSERTVLAAFARMGAPTAP